VASAPWEFEKKCELHPKQGGASEPGNYSPAAQSQEVRKDTAMASIDEVRLTVGQEYDNGQSLVHDVTIEVDIRWSRADHLSGQPYEATYALWGADASIGEPANDHLMLRGTAPTVVRSVGGAQVASLTVDETYLSGQMNEDPGSATDPGFDEAFAVVTLEPIHPPHLVEARSAIVGYEAPAP
jgi:hypothetical protein